MKITDTDSSEKYSEPAVSVIAVIIRDDQQ